MPITLRDLAPFIPAPTAPRYHGGLSRASDVIAQVRQAEQRDAELALRERQMSQQAAQDAQQNARAQEQLDISRGYLGLQSDQQMQARAAEERKMRESAMAEFVDSLSPTADPMRRELAKTRLKSLGIDVDAPTVGQVAEAAAAPVAAPTVTPEGGVTPAAAPTGAPPGAPSLAQEENAFNWISPVRPGPARMDIPPPLPPPQAIQSAPLASLAPSGPSAPALPSPGTAALAGGAAGLTDNALTMGAVDATRALPRLSLGVPPAAPGLPAPGVQVPAAAAPGAAQAASPLGGAGIPAPGGGGIPPVPPSPEVTSWRLRRGDDVLLELDPTAAGEAQQQVIADWAGPLVASARTPEERRAASLAMDIAKRTAEATGSTKAALDAGRNAYEFEIKEANSTKRAGMAGASRVAAAQREFGSTGMGKEDYSVRADLTGHVDKIVQQVSSQQKVSAVNDTMREFDKLLALSNEDTGFADSNAVVSFITAMQQRVSNADYEVAMGSGGVYSQLESFVKRFAPGAKGQLSADYMKQVKGAADALKQSLFQEKVKIAGQAENMMRQRAKILRLGEEDTELLVEGARAPFLPEGYRPPKPKTPAPVPMQRGGGQPAAPTRSSTGSGSLNERARRLGI